MNRSNAFTDGLNVGILTAYGETDSTAISEGQARARILDSGGIGSEPDLTVGGLDINATSQDSANGRVIAAGGGLISAQSNEAIAETNPVVEATIGTNKVIESTGNITLFASADPEADGYAKGTSGGAVDVTSSKSTVEVKPDVTAKILAGSVITTTGLVKVEAEAVPQSGNTPTYLVTAADSTLDTLSVASHGTETGDAVEYRVGVPSTSPIQDVDPSESGTNTKVSEPITDNDGNVVGTIETDRAYNVIRISADVLAFGNVFSGVSVDSSTETILFDSPHNFISGDKVIYRKASGVTADISGLSEGSSYYVLVVDERSIKLVDSFVKATDPDSVFKSFNPDTDINGVWIDVGSGHGFEVGDNVTYEAPEALEFFSAQVDVDDQEEDGKAVIATLPSVLPAPTTLRTISAS